MAGMSPVMTAVSGLPSKVPGSTVVSSVLGKQLRKRAAEGWVGDARGGASEEGFDGCAAEAAVGGGGTPGCEGVLRASDGGEEAGGGQGGCGGACHAEERAAVNHARRHGFWEDLRG